MNRRVGSALVFAVLAGCMAAPAPKLSSADVTTPVRPWPTAMPARSNDRPKILAVYLSGTRVRSGDSWSGRVATSMNVASLEVRAPSFTFSAPRTSYGQFAFTVHTIFVPPFYRRVYTVALIARNAAGVATERDVDIDFR